MQKRIVKKFNSLQEFQNWLEHFKTNQKVIDVLQKADGYEVVIDGFYRKEIK